MVAATVERTLHGPARTYNAFFVHAGHTRQGIGRRIIEACGAAAQQASFNRMELGATLPREPQYAALGFAVTDRIEIAAGRGVAVLRPRGQDARS